MKIIEIDPGFYIGGRGWSCSQAPVYVYHYTISIVQLWNFLNTIRTYFKKWYFEIIFLILVDFFVILA